MKKNNLLKKRFFSIILTIAVALSMMLTIAWADADGWVSTQSDAAEMANANEANGVATQAMTFNKNYYTEDGVISSEKVVCYLISANAPLTEEWYYVNADMTVNADLTVDRDGTVNFIIASGRTLTINGTLTIKGNNTGSADLKIYGETAAGGYVVVNNSDSSKSNGSAIVSKDEQTAYIQLIGGEMTATGAGYNTENGTGAALSNVRLLSEVNETIKRTAEVKCVVTGSDPEQKVEDTQKETSVTISRCECAEKDWKFEQGTGENGGKHRGYCNLCGYVSNWNAETEGYVDCDFNDVPVSADAAGHYRTCYCGRQENTTTPHYMDAVPTADGSGHTQSCGYCGYTPAGSPVKAHVYDENGECTVCGFSIVAKDNNGKFYGSVNDALESVNDGGTVTLETQDTSGNKEIEEEVEFSRAGVTVNLVMNGYTLKNEGNSTITVENGTLTIADDATITQNGGSQDTVSSAIRVTGGTLTFEKDVTAQGGACSSAQSPAIEVTGGSLVFKGDLTAKGGYADGYGNADKQAAAVYAEGGVLDFQKGLDLSGGLTLTKSASLANGLTQGSFWSKAASGPDGKQVKMLSVEGAKNHKYLDELLADGYAFVDKDDSTLFRCVSSFVSWSGDVTIISHTHTWGPAASGDNYECTTCTKACSHDGGFSSGKCEVCGKPCPHAQADAGNNYHCNECNQQMVARIQTDKYKWSHFADLASAMNAATDGQTVTLLKDAELLSSPEIYDEAKNDKPHVITLDMNGHNITGEFAVSIGRHVESAPPTVYAVNTEYPTTLKIIGSGDISLGIYALSVYPLAALDLSEWKGDSISKVSTNDGSGENEEGQFIATNYTGHINSLELGYGKKDVITKSKLSRGSYGEIVLLGTFGENFKHGDLLEAGYAFQHTDGTFAEYNAIPEQHKISNVQVVECTTHVTDTDEGTQCIYCNQSAAEGAVAKIKTADGKNFYYNDLKTAVEKADNDDTIMLLNNVELTEPLSIEADESNGWRNNLTLDLNGKTISCSKEDTTTIFTSITLTICDSSNEKTGEITQNAVYAVRAVQGGTLKITGGNFGMVYAIDGSEISGGTFSKIGAYDVRGSEIKLHTVLANGYAFADSTGNIVNGYEKSNAENVTVVSHPKHSGNPCACGNPCENTTEMDNTGYCPDCGELLAQAKVTANDETTYTTDFRYAVQNAVDGTTVTLLQNVKLPSYDEDNYNNDIYIQQGNFTIDWDGHILSGATYKNLITITQHASVTLKDSSESGDGGVRNTGGKAVCVNILGSYNVTIKGGVYSPHVFKGDDCQGIFQISGGIFENPENAGVRYALKNGESKRSDELSDLLAEGYTFAYGKDGTDLIDVYKNVNTEIYKTVYVVSHTHSNFDENDKCKCGFTCEHTTVDSDNSCAICGKAIVAKVGDKGYTSIEKAIADAKGGIVKLLTDAETITINESLTLDLNGKNVDSLTVSAKATIKDSAETKGVITSLTVSGDLKIKDLLEKDYSFKTGESTWATAEQLEGQSIQSASIVQVPIRSISIDTKNLTANYGYAADNSPELTCVLNDGGSADDATYQWYRVGEATPIAGTKAYTVPTGFDAGEYKYCCVAMIDGYSVTSDTVTVEIKKVAPTYTAPTANEGLSYTGLAQNLIEAGSTAHGIIEYSLEENGTYSTAIPTGTNAGTYTVWYKVIGDNNHNNVDPQSITAKIEKCEISISDFAITPKTYTNGDKTATVTEVIFANLQNGETLALGEDFTVAAEFENANAGTRSATLTVTLSETAKAKNYTLAKNTLAKKFTIEKAEAPALSNVSKSVTYGDNAQKTASVAEAGMPTDAGTLKYTKGSTSATNVDWSVGTDGTVTYTISGANAGTAITLPIKISSTNYEDTTVNVVITIEKAAPSLEITNRAALNRTYDGNFVDAVYTTNGDGKVNVEYYEGNSKLDAAPTDAGTYKVIVKLAAGINYEAAQTEAEFTIAKRSIEGAAISLGDELAYTGKEQTQAVKSVTVKLDEATSLQATYDVSENIGTDAGTYTLTVTGNGNFEGTATKAFEIKQAEVTLTDAADNTPVQNAIYKDTEVIKATFKNKKVTVNFNGQEVELEGVWTLTETSEGEKFESTGEFDREAVFTPVDSNFAPIKKTVKIKVTNRAAAGGAILPTTEVTTVDKAGQTGEKVTTSPSEVKNETKTDENGNQVTTAKVTVSAANQKEILKQAKDNKSSEILIKVSEKDVKDGAKLELSLDKSFIEDILNKTDADLTIQTPDGEKTFTQEELKKLAEAATGSTITLDPAASTNPSEPTNPDGTLTPAQSKLVKGVQNTTIVLKSKLTKKGKIRLTWTKSKGYKLDRFEIYRSVKKNSGYGKKAFFTTKDGSTAKYLNTKSLKKGKTYYYKLRGVRIIDGKKYYTKWSNKTWKTVK